MDYESAGEYCRRDIERQYEMREIWKHRQHGIGSMIFLVGVMCGITGIVMTTVYYNNVKDSVQEFKFLGPFLLTLAVIFLLGGVVLTETCDCRRRCCPSERHYLEENMQLHQRSTPRKENKGKFLELRRDLSKSKSAMSGISIPVSCQMPSEADVVNCNTPDDNCSQKECKRKFSIQSLTNIMIQFNSKVEPEPTGMSRSVSA